MDEESITMVTEGVLRKSRSEAEGFMPQPLHVPAIARWAVVPYDMCTMMQRKEWGATAKKMPKCTP